MHPRSFYCSSRFVESEREVPLPITVAGMGEQRTADEKRMRLRYAGICRMCGVDLPARTEAVYERTTKTVRCLMHDPDAAAQSGPEPAPEPTPVVVSEVTRGATDELADVEAWDTWWFGASRVREASAC